jgi:ABC-type nitrate/sulfonate/bicarbonate transport system substrate-binding protein
VIKDYGDSLRRLNLVKSGEIKATTLSEPFTSLAREQGLKVLVNLVGEKIPWVFTGIVATRVALNSRRDALKRFLRGTIEGNYLAFTDEARAKAILAKELGISDQKIVDINYREFRDNTPLNSDIAEEAARNTLAHFPQTGGKLEGYIDTSLIDEIRKEGFIASMQQKYNRR